MILLVFLPLFAGAVDMSHDDRLMHPAKITVELMNPSQWNKHSLLRICCSEINDFENAGALVQNYHPCVADVMFQCIFLHKMPMYIWSKLNWIYVSGLKENHRWLHIWWTRNYLKRCALDSPNVTDCGFSTALIQSDAAWRERTQSTPGGKNGLGDFYLPG